MTDYVPRVYSLGLPEQEREHAEHLQNQLLHLNSFLRDFDAALALFGFSAQQQNALRARFDVTKFPQNEHEMTRRKEHFRGLDILGSWSQMAARDGAMTIFHFNRTIDGIRDTTFRLRTLASMVDREKMKSMEALREKRFPGFVAIRHAVGHAGELTSTPEARSRNSSNIGNYKAHGFDLEGVKELFIGNALMGTTFTVTIAGKILSYEITPQTLTNMKEVQAELHESFRSAEQETLAGHHRTRGEQIEKWRAEQQRSKD